MITLTLFSKDISSPSTKPNITDSDSVWKVNGIPHQFVWKVSNGDQLRLTRQT